MYDDLLVPTDGSELGDGAVAHAAALAEAFDATVHVLSVVDTRTRFETPSAGVAPDAWLDAERERAGAAVRKTADALPDSVETTTEVLDGTPASTIVEYAREGDVDAVVMATHGRTGLDRYLIGSVTEKVVRSSPVPVLTVNTSEEREL